MWLSDALPMQLKKLGIQLSIYPTATLTFVILKMPAGKFGSARIPGRARNTRKKFACS
jgi:hypothetical protein